ncbi:MAG: peptidoglycan bridge formation glycyltransferase FemA/FemB family protein [Patescibacteria group bacterium]
MQLREFTEEQSTAYQSLVQINGCFLQDWQWGEFQKSIGKKVFRFGIEENGVLIFCAQGYLQRIKNKSYFFLPYGPTLKPEVLSRFEEIFKFFCAELKKIHPDLIFVRYEPFFDVIVNGAKKSIDLNPHKTLILDLHKAEEELLSSMHPKTRYNIKVAVKHNIAIQEENELKPEALDLLIQTSKRAGIRGFNPDYYTQLVKYFSSNKDISVKVYTASHEGELLAVNIILEYKHGYIKNLGTYLFGGSSDIKRNLMAPYLLHWHVIQGLKRQGFEKYDFWGVEEEPKHPWHGFSKFKLGFGGEIIKHGGTWDYVLNPAWYNIYIFIRKLNRFIK